jgi:SHS2 domain-containing protein
MKEAGYREIDHTADWEIEAWAFTIEQLIEQTARGMYGLINPTLMDDKKVTRSINLISHDQEGLLVGFLNELLFLLEQEGLVFNEYKITLDELDLCAEVTGTRVSQVDLQIKAATWHKIAINQKEGYLTVRIVFDV